MQRIIPWRGDLYSEGILGCRVLLLGESNYDPRGSSPVERREMFVIDNVNDCVFNGRVSFFTKAAKLLLMANQISKIDRPRIEDVWRRIAFHNVIQHVFSGPRIRPSADMWQSGRAALGDVFEELKPDLVVVMGLELAFNIRSPPSAARIAHPSSFGFRYGPWVAEIQSRWPGAPNKAMQATCEDARA